MTEQKTAPKQTSKVATVIRHGALALGAGAIMGLVYWLLHVESPAPSPIGLVGLLGIVAGEQGFPFLRGLLKRLHKP